MRRRPLRCVCTGFTFVELLIASTMMAILFVGLAAHLRGGIDVWDRATRTAGMIQERRVGLARLGRDLENGFAIAQAGEEDVVFGAPPKLPAPMFTAQTMRWYTWRQPRGEEPGRVQAVGYACEEVDGAWGLWRTPLALGQARMADPQVAPEMILPGCRTLAVQYAYLPGGASEEERQRSEPLLWSSEWKYEQDLPKLVRVMLTLVSGPRKPEAVLSQQFLIPAGTLKPFEEPSS